MFNLIGRNVEKIILQSQEEIGILEGHIEFQEKESTARIKDLTDVINRPRVLSVFYYQFFQEQPDGTYVWKGFVVMMV
jgi:hypothetical protein